MNEGLAQALLKRIQEENIKDKHSLNMCKQQFAKENNLKHVPTDIELSNLATPKQRDALKTVLSIKPVRTMAGVAPVALMTAPHKCPHGTCVYCPGGPGSPFGDVPQSYTGKEPATRRAIRNRYDAYLQVMNRLEHYVVMNQVPEKVEIIVMGGTFLTLHKTYKDAFMRDVFKALNDFGDLFYKEKLDIATFNDYFEMQTKKDDEGREERIHEKLLKKKEEPSTLEEEQKKNETASIRCVALVIETGAEACDIDELLRFGCTRVELGVQSVYPEIVKGINRGHTSEDSIKKTQELKDAAFKVTYHYMPGLPEPDFKRITYEKDLQGLKELYENPDYKPDMLKIYPCMVMPGTELLKYYEDKTFVPLGTDEAAKMLAEFLPTLPDYVRVMRIQRDIPTPQTVAGVDRTNLRQYVDDVMSKEGVKSRDIRTREIGRTKEEGKVAYRTIEYDASHGKEFFIEAHIGESIVGFARIRFPFKPTRKEIDTDTALLRELHVYGTATALGEQGNIQHKGVGKELMKLAEKIAKDNGKKKLLVISGIGVKEYYRKLEYEDDGVYVSKYLQNP